MWLLGNYWEYTKGFLTHAGGLLRLARCTHTVLHNTHFGTSSRVPVGYDWQQCCCHFFHILFLLKFLLIFTFLLFLPLSILLNEQVIASKSVFSKKKMTTLITLVFLLRNGCGWWRNSPNVTRLVLSPQIISKCQSTNQEFMQKSCVLILTIIH